MRLSDIRLPNPEQVVECSSQQCNQFFKLKDGWAFPGRGKEDTEVRLYFFHSARCYLNALPVEALWRA